MDYISPDLWSVDYFSIFVFSIILVTIRVVHLMEHQGKSILSFISITVQSRAKDLYENKLTF